LFSELKKMDENLKKQTVGPSLVNNEKRKEMYRKLRQDMEKDSKEEQEAKYQKRVEDLEKKDQVVT
jgi:hypothetical protein